MAITLSEFAKMPRPDTSLSNNVVQSLRNAAGCHDGCLVEVVLGRNEVEPETWFRLHHNGKEIYVHLADALTAVPDTREQTLRDAFVALAGHVAKNLNPDPDEPLPSILEGIW